MAKTYNSFSGIDITPIFQGQPIGEIQAVSYSINREKAPIYTMGSANPRSFSRGKRGIAGSLIFIVFDRHALLSEMIARGAKFSADTDETGIVPQEIKSLESEQLLAPGGTDQGEETFGQEISAPWYADQIPPFEIVLAASNEHGATSTMAIYGVEILNENSGVSIDDIVTEQQYTYIARNITPWVVRNDDNVQNRTGFTS